MKHPQPDLEQADQHPALRLVKDVPTHLATANFTDSSLLSMTLAPFGLCLTHDLTHGLEVKQEQDSLYVGQHHLADLPRCADGGRLNLTTLSSLFPKLLPDNVPLILRRLGLNLNDQTLITPDGRSFRCYWGTKHPEYLTVYKDVDWQVLLDNSAHGLFLEFDGLQWLTLETLGPLIPDQATL